MNGPAARTVRIPLTFLGPGRYNAVAVIDNADDPAAVKIEQTTRTRNDTLTIAMRAAGGFVVRLTTGGSR